MAGWADYNLFFYGLKALAMQALWRTLWHSRWRLALLAWVVGVATASLWHAWHTPGQPLYVKLDNTLDRVAPLVVFEHGNDFTQERITLTQLQPGERRVVALNHRPGMGYTITVDWGGGRQNSVCVGKFTDSWVNHVLLTPEGIVSRD